MINLTQRQRDVLEHIVVDPDAWCVHNLASCATEIEAAARLEAKVSRWAAAYDEAKDSSDYLNRAQRDAAAAAQRI
jgi:hypothetical protein|tara:strand:- start:13833 stop:14060 length:228 start_codon:yes stop_codon:yes gene_type:complete